MRVPEGRSRMAVYVRDAALSQLDLKACLEFVESATQASFLKLQPGEVSSNQRYIRDCIPRRWVLIVQHLDPAADGFSFRLEAFAQDRVAITPITPFHATRTLAVPRG